MTILYCVFSGGGGSGGTGGSTDKKTHALEQKVLKLMDELTELHRNKGEVIRLNIYFECYRQHSSIKNQY